MRLPSKRLIVSGVAAWLIAFALGGMDSRHASIASSGNPGQKTWLGALPFEGVAFAQSQAPNTQMSEVAFKNIQVLKGIPVDEFREEFGLSMNFEISSTVPLPIGTLPFRSIGTFSASAESDRTSFPFLKIPPSLEL